MSRIYMRGLKAKLENLVSIQEYEVRHNKKVRDNFTKIVSFHTT